MEKLELKHIAPYLPYRLKCTNSKESYLQTGEDRTGILETLSVNDEECVIMGEDGYFLVSCDDIVPILRPIEDLSKEIKINGKKFTPIIELAKLFHTVKQPTVIKYDGIKDYGDYGIKVNCYIGAIDERRYSEYSIRHDIDLILHNSFLEVSKLIEWHFDVFGLIDKGLAVSYSDVQSSLNEG
jgi:hypothetical protein